MNDAVEIFQTMRHGSPLSQTQRMVLKGTMAELQMGIYNAPTDADQVEDRKGVEFLPQSYLGRGSLGASSAVRPGTR